MLRFIEQSTIFAHENGKLIITILVSLVIESSCAQLSVDGESNSYEVLLVIMPSLIFF